MDKPLKLIKIGIDLESEKYRSMVIAAIKDLLDCLWQEEGMISQYWIEIEN